MLMNIQIVEYHNFAPLMFGLGLTHNKRRRNRIRSVPGDSVEGKLLPAKELNKFAWHGGESESNTLLKIICG